jgi:hypothetical protein
MSEGIRGMSADLIFQDEVADVGHQTFQKMYTMGSEKPMMIPGRRMGKSHALNMQMVGRAVTEMLDQKLQPQKILMDQRTFDDLLAWFGEPESEPNMELLLGGPVSVPGWALPPPFRERTSIPFFTISSERFEKTEQELLAYQMPITKIIEDNSVKDIQEIEDREFLDYLRPMISDFEIAPGVWALPPKEFDDIFSKQPKDPFDDLFEKE